MTEMSLHSPWQQQQVYRTDPMPKYELSGSGRDMFRSANPPSIYNSRQAGVFKQPGTGSSLDFCSGYIRTSRTDPMPRFEPSGGGRDMFCSAAPRKK